MTLSAGAASKHSVDPTRFRHIVSHHPTGVCVVTAVNLDGLRVGMLVGAFTNVSPRPPLVPSCPIETLPLRNKRKLRDTPALKFSTQIGWVSAGGSPFRSSPALLDMNAHEATN